LKNTWLFPVVQSLHVVGLALFVGTAALADYAVLRGRSRRSEDRWTYWGLGLMLATGIALFWADAGRYLANPAFRLKIGLVAAGLVFHFFGHRSSRAGATFSLILWTAVVVSSRLIEDFDK
jgi:hypothetical protein